MSTGDAASVGEVFNGLDAAMRRPVEILGLLQIAAQLDAIERGERIEHFETVRADGSRRSYAVPRIGVNGDAPSASSARIQPPPTVDGAEND